MQKLRCKKDSSTCMKDSESLYAHLCSINDSARRGGAWLVYEERRYGGGSWRRQVLKVRVVESRRGGLARSGRYITYVGMEREGVRQPRGSVEYGKI